MNVQVFPCILYDCANKYESFNRKHKIIREFLKVPIMLCTPDDVNVIVFMYPPDATICMNKNDTYSTTLKKYFNILST